MDEHQDRIPVYVVSGHVQLVALRSATANMQMKQIKINHHFRWAGTTLLSGLLAWTVAAAIEPDEVRRFEDVFVVSAYAPDRVRIEVSWDIAPGYFLYNNRFLQFSVQTPGVETGAPQLPRGEVSFDELLGEEVEKYHGRMTVTLPLLAVDSNIDGLRLKVRSQGCLEGVLCYPPTEQTVLVGLPPAVAEAPGPSAAGVELSNPSVAQQGIPGKSLDLEALLNGPGKLPLSGPGGSDSADQALSADDAFVYEAIAFNADTVLARLTAQPGYYLYRDKLAFRVADASRFSVRQVSLPDGTIKDDPEFGSVPVLYGQVEIPIRLNRPAGPATTISLRAEFQGRSSSPWLTLPAGK